MTARKTKGRTARQRVLIARPEAFCAYVGLSLKFVIKDRFFYPTEISGHFLRERDAWADAAARIRGRGKGAG